MDESRYSRNTALFGTVGQAQIAATSATIVGLGGLGAHVAQQLAYLGVVQFGLIDDDIVTESSLNRVIGTTPAHVLARTSKVRAAEALILAVQPDAKINAVQAKVTRDRQDEAGELIRSSDIVFGCLDRESPRLFLTDLCSAFAITYIDLATDTGGETEDWYGGRVVVCDGSRCLSCLDLLDQRQIRLEQMTDEEREIERRIYGLSVDALGSTGPAIVSVNGVVASLAVTEFMAHQTDLRPAAPQLIYRGDLSRVTLSRDAARPGCPYCARWPATRTVLPQA